MVHDKAWATEDTTQLRNVALPLLDKDIILFRHQLCVCFYLCFITIFVLPQLTHSTLMPVLVLINTVIGNQYLYSTLLSASLHHHITVTAFTVNAICLCLE